MAFRVLCETMRLNSVSRARSGPLMACSVASPNFCGRRGALARLFLLRGAAESQQNLPMIQAFLIINNFGKPRLLKFYKQTVRMAPAHGHVFLFTRFSLHALRSPSKSSSRSCASSSRR